MKRDLNDYNNIDKDLSILCNLYLPQCEIDEVISYYRETYDLEKSVRMLKQEKEKADEEKVIKYVNSQAKRKRK